jgi:GAF domain-containing protein
MVVSSLEPDTLPQETEGRLTDFTELVATAIANSEARDEAGRLAAEQAALRRVATLVAEDVPPSELFSAVAREVGTLLGADFARMVRFEDATSSRCPPGPLWGNSLLFRIAGKCTQAIRRR